MESTSLMFDNVKFEKEKAMARFNHLRRVVKLWQVFEIFVVFGLISWWCSARARAVFGGYLVEFSSYLFNHHVVFLVGNAIIILLLMLCRDNDVVALSGGRDFYDDYVKYSEAAAAAAAAAAHQRDGTLSPPPDTEDDAAAAPESGGGGDYEKQIVVRAEETRPVTQNDDVAAAIEEATRQIKKFQRTQSELLKREIAVQRRPELRRSETENCRKAESPDAAEIENLSSEEFRRRIDAFIDEHWSKRRRNSNQLEEIKNNHQLLLRNIN